MDTGHACQSCETLVDDRKAHQRGIADRMIDEHRHGKAFDPSSDGGREMRARYRHTLSTSHAPSGRAVAERIRREEAYELRRQQAADAERARSAAACADCGLSDAAGLCLPCTERRGTERTLVEAVDVAVATRFDLDDVAGTVAMWEECYRTTREVLDERLLQLEHAGLDSATVAFTGRRLVQGLLADRRRAALSHGERELARLLARLRSVRSLAPRSQVGH